MGNENRHLWQFQWVRELIILVIIGLVAWLAYEIRAVLSPILIGLTLAYVVNPIVTWAHVKRRIPRWFTTSLILLASVFSLGMLALIITPRIVQQVAMLAGNLRAYTRVLLQKINVTPEILQGWIDRALGRDVATVGTDAEGDLVVEIETSNTREVDTPQTASPTGDTTPATPRLPDAAVDPATQAPAEDIAVAPDSDLANGLDPAATADPAEAAAPANGFPGGDFLNEQSFEMVGKAASVVMRGLDIGVGVVGSTIGMISYLMIAVIVIAFCFYFFSWRFNRIVAWFDQFIPAAHREKTVHIIKRMDRSVSAFIRGRLVQSLTMGIVLSFGWWMAGVPYWLLLGVLSGLLNLIPFAAVVGCVAATVLAVVDHLAAGGSFSVWVLAWPIIVYSIAQLLDGWVVEPLVQGKATDLDPLAVLLAVIIGSAIAGLLGLILAIPITACLKILAEEVVIPKARAYMTKLEID